MDWVLLNEPFQVLAWPDQAPALGFHQALNHWNPCLSKAPSAVSVSSYEDHVHAGRLQIEIINKHLDLSRVLIETTLRSFTKIIIVVYRMWN